MKTLLSAITLAVLSFNVSAGMVVIGNNAGVDSLSKSDVKKLFMGKKSKLANGTKAQIIELVDGSEGDLPSMGSQRVVVNLSYNLLGQG